jgi:hypothetical protein
MAMSGLKIFLLVVVGILISVSFSFAQARSDSTKSAGEIITPAQMLDTTKQGIPGFGEDLVLGEIAIEAIIEKPNVDIIPRRKKPEIDELIFIDRSFEKEIKAVPKEFHLYDKELDEPKKLDRLRKVLTKSKDNK